MTHTERGMDVERLYAVKNLDELRDDVVPTGFPEKLAELTAAGAWELVERTDPWRSMPVGEPEVRHRIWAFGVR
ncbi:MAG: hypothetical protein EXQ94_09365 [Alphaproteobacteria bacterium]|nr:hypothetical protein [Alphaproteobacteria bacterium]